MVRKLRNADMAAAVDAAHTVEAAVEAAVDAAAKTARTVAQQDRLELERWRGGITSDVKNLADDFKDERATAAAHRSDLRTVIASLSSAVQTVASKVDQVLPIAGTVANMGPVLNEVERTVKEIAPLARDYRDTKNQAVGGLKVARWVAQVGWGLLGGAAALAAGYFLQYVLPKFL